MDAEPAPAEQERRRREDRRRGREPGQGRDPAAELEKATGLPTTLWDERRTTVEAHAILHTGGKRMKDHKKNVDAVAASLILEGYLSFLKTKKTSP